MNANFLAIIKKIISEQGETILAEPKRLKGWISDYANNEPKAERLAFVRCIEYGAYTDLKNAPAEDRASVKSRLTQRLHSEEGLDTALCAGALDLLEAAMFGKPNEAAKPEAPSKSPLSETTPAQESKPFPVERYYPSPIANDLSTMSGKQVETKPTKKKHLAWIVLLAVVMVSAVIGLIAVMYYFSGNQDTFSYNPSPAANYTHESSLPPSPVQPKRDINGLTAADYDENGWAQKDGKWVASPDGARYSAQPANTERPHVRIVNSTGYTVWYVYVVASTAQFWGNDKLGSGILSSGSSVLIDLPSSSTNRYGIRLKDLDGDTYTKWNIPISNNQTVTFTIQDLDID